MIKTSKISSVVALCLSISLSTYIQAADLTASSGGPTVYFSDNSPVNTSGITLNKRPGDTWFNVYDQTNHWWLIHGLITQDSHLSMDIASNGDISLANGSVFIDKSANKVGIGTTLPADNVDIVDTTTTSSGGLLPITQGSAKVRMEAFNGSKWSMGANYFHGIEIIGSTVQRNSFQITDLNTSITPVVIKQGSSANLLYLNGNTMSTYGNLYVDDNITSAGNIKSSVSAANTVGDGLTTLMVLEATNTDTSKVSDTAFVLRNGRTGKQWNFRTTQDGKGFAATINGTGGTEFEIVNDTNDFHNTKLYIGGKLVFANGKIQAGVLP